MTYTNFKLFIANVSLSLLDQPLRLTLAGKANDKESVSMIRERKWTNHEVAELKVMYESGEPLKAIAERLDRSVSAIKSRAQMHQYYRPTTYGLNRVKALQARAIECGIDEAHLPSNPSDLKILILLTQLHLANKADLDARCAIKESTRNKSVSRLRTAGLVFIDDYSSPAEVILTRKAFQTRPEPALADEDQIKIGVLPTMEKLVSELSVWAPACVPNQDTVERFKAFIIRQLTNARSGEVSPADFYSIFYKSERK